MIPSPTTGSLRHRAGNGSIVHVRRHGAGQGPRLLLTHGNGLAADAYLPFWGGLTDRFEIFVHDLRNHGWNRPGRLENHRIAEQQVHNKVSDLGLLAETAAAARENLAIEDIDAVADGGYYKIEDIEACEAAGVTPFVPKPDRSPARRNGHFPKSAFRYDPATDSCGCPGGHRLAPLYRTRVDKTRPETLIVNYENRAACNACALRDRCTKKTYRSIGRYENEAVLDRMAARLAAQPEMMDRRRETVEHPFGSIKQWMGQGAFLTKRLDNVRAEFSLTALAYNMRRAINIVGIPSMIATVTA